MNDVCPFRYDQIGGNIFINILSVYHPQGSPYVPFIIINMQVVTLLRFSPATNIPNDHILNKDLVFLSPCCVSCFL